jgi:type 2 lantibiotic biosynthesis protein LanM
MSRLDAADPAWYHALTLRERMAPAAQQPIADPAIDLGRAQQRMQDWKAQPPFQDAACFAQRLAQDGLDEALFLRLLGEPIAAVRDRALQPPAWLCALAAGLSQDSSDVPPFSLAALMQQNETAGFLQATVPLIAAGCQRLQAEIAAMAEQYPHIPFDRRKIIDLLLANLLPALLMTLGRTLVLELNVARMRGQLQGTTPAERFLSFIQLLEQPETTVALFQEYPILARQVVLRIDTWVTFSLEFLGHLCADWLAVRAQFTPTAEPGLLATISGNAGDLHHGGRAVLIATFESGLRLVYKPRAMGVDVHFQTLLGWLNDRSDLPPFQCLKVIDRSSYGWVEFVEARPCTTPAEIERFYQRQGAYLALLYALEAVDFHYENLIAAGEHPILIDLESLFHPKLVNLHTQQAARLAGSMLAHSVLRIGLLPLWMWMTEDSDGIDLSGLGAQDGQLTPGPVLQWDAIGTDTMHVVRKRAEMPGGQNRPTLNGRDVDVQEYSAALTVGFIRMYSLLIEQRAALLAPDGPLACFANDDVRVIARPTHMYGKLQSESLHPDLLRDGLEREQFFDRLWVGAVAQPELIPLIPSERFDLFHGDIPLFTSYPNARSLWNSVGEEIPNMFNESAMAAATRRIRQLDPQDMERQSWFIRASLATLSLAPHATRPLQRAVGARAPAAEGRPVTREQLLTVACEVGDRLATLALHGENDISWLGMTFVNRSRWWLTPIGVDLYAGISGVALFLGYLGAIVGQARYTELAQRGIATVCGQLEELRRFQLGVGGFTGWGSLIYTLTHLGTLWDMPALWNHIDTVLEWLPAQIDQDKQYDIIGGSAGCIASLLGLYRCRPREETLALAIQCGDRLVAEARPMQQGIAWMFNLGRSQPLTGFAHGTAGIATALLELAAASGIERFRAAGLAALAYERSQFSAEVGNWPDLRDPELSGFVLPAGQQAFGTAWCHGAPGIGLGRLQLLPILDDATIRAEITIAVQTTLSQGFGANHSLCHGDLGNLELVVEAGRRLGRPDWLAQAEQRTASIFDHIAEQGWLCGVPLGVETPDLMMGIAGIGYGCLRLAEPERIPRVLQLEAPRR